MSAVAADVTSVVEVAEDPGEPPGRLRKNIAALASSQVLTWSTTLAASFVVPRALGPKQMGAYSGAVSVTVIMVMMVSFVTGDFLVREMVIDKTRAGRIAGVALGVRLLLAPLFAGAIYGYVHLAGVDRGTARLFYLLGGAAVARAFSDPLQAIFKSVQRMGLVAASNLISTSSVGLLAIGLVLIGQRAEGLAWCDMVIAASLLILNAGWAWRIQRIRLAPNGREMASLSRQALPFAPLQIVMMAYLYIDAVLLSLMQKPEVLGWYSVGMRLLGTLLFVPTILATAWYPRLIEAWQESAGALKREARGFLEIIPAVSLPIAAATALAAGPVIRLVFGPAYAPSVPVMIVLGMCVVPMSVGIGLGQILIAIRRPLLVSALLGGGIAVNVGLNLLLIPMFASRYANGALGAATSLLLTEVLIATGMVAVAGRQILDVKSLRRLPGAALASVAMWLTGYAARPLGPVSYVMAAVVFAGLVAAAGVVTRQERAAVFAFAARKLGRRSPDEEVAA